MKQMKKSRILLGVLLMLSFSIIAQTTPKVQNLRTEYLQNPVGIDVKTPRFSWEMSHSARGAKQTAYEITVSTNQSGENPVWTSGKVETDRSVNNPYNGPTLAPSTRYYWHVNIWDHTNTQLTSTEAVFFETDLS